MPTLYELRIAKNWSQRQLAELAGVTGPTISRMENGHEVQEDTLKQVCQALGVLRSDVTGVKVYSAVQAAARRKKTARAS